MFPAEFDYHRAGSVDEALALLGQNPEAKLLAGGHSLLPMMKLRLAQPAALVDIARIAELRGIREGQGSVIIGAATPHAEVAASRLVQDACPLVAEAAGQIADPAVRNRGTVGGNIAHADPASDWPAVLVVVGATIHLKGGAGATRTVAAKAFFLDLMTTALSEGEIITAVEVPRLPAGTGSCYLKLEHPASGYALCGAAAWVLLENGKVGHAGLAYNGIAATPVGVDLSALFGGAADDEAIAKALSGLTVTDPLSDLYASGPYRVELAKVYGKRALIRARERAAG